MSLFPSIQPQAAENETGLAGAKDVVWDMEADAPVFAGGSPQFCTGLEAVRGQIRRALETERLRWGAYSTDYGSEVPSLVGQPYTIDVKTSEAARFVREAVEILPYVVSVSDADVTFADGHLTAYCTVNTVYGQAEVTASV